MHDTAQESPRSGEAVVLKADWQYDGSERGRHYLVEAFLGDRRVGIAYGRYEPGGLLILEKIEIEPTERSRGYGTAVIECIRERARECACRQMMFKGVREANEGAIRLYQSLGARPIPRSDQLIDFVLAPP